MSPGPRCEFIGRAELASAFRDWTPAQCKACPDGHSSGVFLAAVELWPRAVPLDVVVHQIDPEASNPYVQRNAEGFRSSIVLITANEYTSVVALSHQVREA